MSVFAYQEGNVSWEMLLLYNIGKKSNYTNRLPLYSKMLLLTAWFYELTILNLLFFKKKKDQNQVNLKQKFSLMTRFKLQTDFSIKLN